MSVIATIGNVDLLAPKEATARLGEDGVFTASVKWKIHVKDATGLTWVDLLPDVVATPFVNAGELPKRGTQYLNTQATCRETYADVESNFVYTFTADYSSKNSTEAERGTDEQPQNDRPLINWVASQESRAIYKDRNEQPILNTAGDPIIETRDENIIGVSVKSNVLQVPSWVLSYRNSINNAPFSLINGLTVGTNVARFVLPSGFISEPKERNDTIYYEFTYELHFDEQDLHQGKPINVGKREKIDIGGGNYELRNITNEDGTECTDYVPLDEDGLKIALPTPSNTLIIDVDKYYEKDFSILPGVIA